MLEAYIAIQTVIFILLLICNNIFTFKIMGLDISMLFRYTLIALYIIEAIIVLFFIRKESAILSVAGIIAFSFMDAAALLINRITVRIYAMLICGITGEILFANAYGALLKGSGIVNAPYNTGYVISIGLFIVFILYLLLIKNKRNNKLVNNMAFIYSLILTFSLFFCINAVNISNPCGVVAILINLVHTLVSFVYIYYSIRENSQAVSLAYWISFSSSLIGLLLMRQYITV